MLSRVLWNIVRSKEFYVLALFRKSASSCILTVQHPLMIYDVYNIISVFMTLYVCE
jgi:hypothetical protein